MTDNASTSGRRRQAKVAAPVSPDWADSLKSIYDAVVDEPLPDDMLALLASLDAEDQQGGPA